MPTLCACLGCYTRGCDITRMPTSIGMVRAAWGVPTLVWWWYGQKQQCHNNRSGGIIESHGGGGGDHGGGVGAGLRGVYSSSLIPYDSDS
eukprot:scaffold29029_cov86-Attheya_sp.AAC.1